MHDVYARARCRDCKVMHDVFAVACSRQSQPMHDVVARGRVLVSLAIYDVWYVDLLWDRRPVMS